MIVLGFLDYITAGLGLVEKQSAKPNRKPQPKKRVSEIDYQFQDSKIAIYEPIDFNDIVKFVKGLKSNIPVIVNFVSLRAENATRGLDFVCGAVCALGGKLERIGDGIYFYAPHSFKINK